MSTSELKLSPSPQYALNYQPLECFKKVTDNIFTPILQPDGQSPQWLNLQFMYPNFSDKLEYNDDCRLFTSQLVKIVILDF